MVGFGSSLRLARRPGWEGAYLDYEALKLLLSQIEAVYEEGNTTTRTTNVHHHHTRTTAQQQLNQFGTTTTVNTSSNAWDDDDDVLYMNTAAATTTTMSSIEDQRRGLGHKSSNKQKKVVQQLRRQQQQQRRRRRQKEQHSDYHHHHHHWNGLEQNDNDNDEHRNNNSSNTNTVRDYKVDVFLESDSDKAYISVDDPMIDDLYSDDSFYTDNEDGDEGDDNINLINDTEIGNDGMGDIIVPKPFAHPPFVQQQYHGNEYNSEEDDDDIIIMQQGKRGYSTSCWGGSSNTNNNESNRMKNSSSIAVAHITTGGSTRKKSSNRHDIRRSSSGGHRKGVNSNGGGGGGGSLIAHSTAAGSNENDFPTQQRQSYHDIFHQQHQQQQSQPITPPWKGHYGTSGINSHYYYQDSLHYLPPVVDESTALLLQAPTLSTTATTPTPFHRSTNDASVSPPTTNYFWNPSNLQTTLLDGGNHVMLVDSTFNRMMVSTTPTTMTLPDTATKKRQQQTNKQRSAHEIRRREERRKRRRQKKQQLRQQREKRVPRHIRIAHMKARAITERFLGLLRAETEKVLLFAQSRLGELADTAGSLRFPSYDQEYAANHLTKISSGDNPPHGTVRHDDYEFGDGGMRPSASSSSDDQYTGGGGGQRPYQHQQWCIDSSDEENNEDQSNPYHHHHRNGIAMNANLLSNSNTQTTMSMTSKAHVPAANTTNSARTKEMDHLRYIQRQMAHFTELRKRRGIFQRNEQILGEDMLFLSAVEEVDGYTAVGVELLHTLKYICINLIAVRKICRKHDRLLMNRMLGGYYHRLRNKNRHHYKQNNIAGVQTLGGMITQISGDTYEAHPSVLGQRSHYKLVGVYDRKVQDLANSRTVQVVSSCLAISLSEYEVARSRADALTRMNSSVSIDSASLCKEKAHHNSGTDSTDDDSLHNAPSTASNISLTRLRYTIMSIFALREVSRNKRDYFMTYLSRIALAFTGQPVIGEGLDGCSRETLDFLVSYDPDRALLMDATVLFDGLKQNRWSHLPLGDVMISSLATATIEMNVSPEIVALMLPHEEDNVAHSVSANPGSTTDTWNAIVNGKLANAMTVSNNTVVIRTLPPVLLRLSRMSLFLYSANYFISHATAATFVKATGSPASYSAILIGIPNVSAILVSMVHCWYGASREVSVVNSVRFPLGATQGFMIFGALMGAVGNAINGYAINKSSITVAIVGRLCLGLAFADILQRDLMSNCVPVHVVSESGKLALSKLVGSVVGIAISAVSAVPIAIQTIDIGKIYSPHTRQLQSSSWLMMLFWIVHLLRALATLRIKDNISMKNKIAKEMKPPNPVTNIEAANVTSDSDSSSSAVIGTPSSVMKRPPLDDVEPMTSAIASMENKNNYLPTSSRREDDMQHEIRRTSSRILSRQWKTMRRIRKLFAFHVGIPITLLLFAYTTFAMEIFCTATPFITDRYFAWSGARAGTFLVCVLAATFPITAVCEIVSRRYEERAVIQRALTYSCIGFLIMINWQSMFALATLFPSLLSDTQGRLSHPYDGKFGVIQYVVGMSIVFTLLTALEGAALSLLSKVSPINIRSILISVGTLSTFIGLFARVLGDTQIVMIDVSHKLINTDIVNSLIVPMILASILMSYCIKKIYFILM